MIQPLSHRSLTKISIALSIYITLLIAANTLGLKLMPFFWNLHLSVGIFCFPVVFLMTDVIGEVYGKSMARTFVVAGFVSTALFIAYSAISILVPWSPDALWARDGYNAVFGISIRISTGFLV